MRLLTDSELRDARDSLERVIGITTVADGITTAAKETGWQRVIDELVRLSTQNAQQMGDDGILVDKNAYKILPEQWVHARVLAMILELSAWMGGQWESHFTGSQKQNFLAEVSRAYDAGKIP